MQGQGSEQEGYHSSTRWVCIRTEQLPHRFVPHFKDKEEGISCTPYLPTVHLESNSSTLLLIAFLAQCIVKVWETRPVLKIKCITIISGCSLSHSLECFQVQGLKCCYQMNTSLKYLHFLIIHRCLWSLDSNICLFIGDQKDLCFAQDSPERLVLFLCSLLLSQHSNSPYSWEKER